MEHCSISPSISKNSVVDNKKDMAFTLKFQCRKEKVECYDNFKHGHSTIC